MSDPNASSRKKSSGMFLLWAALVGAALVVLVGAIYLSTRTGLSGRIAELKKAGEPTTMADLAKTAPAGQDAAKALADLQPDLEALGRAMTPVINEWSRETPLTAAQVALANKTYEQHAETFDKLRKAIRLPEYSLQPTAPDAAVQSLQTRSSESRGTMRLLLLRSEIFAMEGEAEEAAKLGLDAMQLAAHLENEPTLMAYLVAIACRSMAVSSLNDALQAGDVSPEVRQEIRKAIEAYQPDAAFTNALRSERAFVLDKSKGPAAFAMRGQARTLVEFLDQEIETIKASGLKRSDMTGAPPEAQAVLAARNATLRSQAVARCLKMVEALTASADVKPEAIQEDDPFDAGQPLRAVQENGGWTVYSVGPDKKDNGGKGDDFSLRRRVLKASAGN